VCVCVCRSRWPRVLRCGAAAVCLLALRVRISPEARIFVVSVVCLCCQAEVSVTSWSLFQKSPTECGVSECDREAPYWEAMTLNLVEAPQETNIYIYICIQPTSYLWQVSIFAVLVKRTCNSLKKVSIYGRNVSDLCVINARHFGTSWWWNLCISCGHSYGNKHTTVYTIIQYVQQCMFTDNNSFESEKMCLRMQQNSPVPECRILIAVTA
jgi:hypothetical protein